MAPDPDEGLNPDETPAEDMSEIEGAEEGNLFVEPGRVVIQKEDRSLSEFHRWKQRGRLIVDPEWQRNFVWDRKRASRLIESFLQDIPVPVIYLAKNKEGNYEVIDGLQRLTSVFDFFEDAFPLRGLEISRECEGMSFKDLPPALQNKLHDSTLRTFELSPQTPKDLMFVIFERLNTGGIRLNEMEIRNCLFRGGLNDLIKRLARNADFETAINQAHLAKRMSDRALVLRFLAFYERTHHKAKQGLARFITEFFTTYQHAPTDKLADFEKQFKKSMRACVTVFGDKAFRLRYGGESKKQRGEWAGRPNAAIFQVISESFTHYDLGQITRRADAIFEEYVDLVSNDSKWVEYVRIATGESNRLSYVFDTWHQRLALAIDQELPNDSQRIFSKSLKEEMFQQSRECAICGQKIILLMDAALDHDLHYWRGGQTVPENARLVHRHCNATRSTREV